MIPYIVVSIAIVVILGGAWSLWDRFGSGGIQDWMLEVEGLAGLCQEYLDSIAGMSSGLYDLDTIRQLDSARQVTHNQILEALGLSRSSNLDVERFARRYLNQ
jgi:hypothetical protein